MRFPQRRVVGLRRARKRRCAAIGVPPLRNGSSSGAVDRLVEALRRNSWLWEIVEGFDKIFLPDCWLVAGCLAQTVWNVALGNSPGFAIKDVDLIYFDAADLSAEAEAEHEERLRHLFNRLPAKLDVKNEARVHLWYEDRFGYPIAPYRSAADAIATFPTTATAIGIKPREGELEICAPFGLDDLFGLVVRPNKRQITQSIYETKVERWRRVWPQLRCLPWRAANG